MNRSILARRFAVATSALLLTLASAAGPAVAHDDHEGGGGPPEPFVVECGGVEYTLISGNGKWAAAIDRDSRSVFIPKSFSFTIVGTDVHDVEFLNVTETEQQGNGNAHKKQQTITCTFGETFTDDDGNTFTFTGSAEVVRKP